MGLKVDGCNKHSEINKMHIPNGLIWVQRTGIQAPIHDTAFTYGRTSSTTTDDNNGKSTIPGFSNEKHYYYGYSIRRQLVYILSGQRLSERNQGLFF